MQNKQLIFAKRPTGVPEAKTWKIKETPLSKPEEGQFIVRTHYVSLDPAMRGWMNDTKSYIAPMQEGEVMRAGSVGDVVASRHPDFEIGDFVTGWGGVQEYCVTDGEGWHKIDVNLAPMETYLGVLGMPGFTAYFGMLEVGKAERHNTVLISGAAGAVGGVAGQIAKIRGCNVVGIAGGPEKCNYLTDTLGFDAAIDYKNDDIREKLREYCPKGIDVFFDNVGGDILDEALLRLRMNARVVICGAISQYNNTAPIKGPSNYLQLLVRRATMQGMVVMDYAPKYKEASMKLGLWLAQGRLHSEIDVYEGMENFHSTFMRLFTGEKKGKLVLKIN
ncbi:MAG: NADP-dependent oxidoreductase [Saprospiraceae bacterium]